MIIEFLDSLKPGLISLLTALVIVWLGYRLGILAYFKRKEHDEIIKRYLESSIDLIASNVDETLSIFRDNWAHSLRLLKEFRETSKMKLPMRKESYKERFSNYKPSSFSIAPFYRINLILDDKIIWESCQDLYAFVDNTYNFFENDLRLAIEAHQSDNVEIDDIDRFCDEYGKIIIDYNEKSKRYYIIIEVLRRISFYFETNSIGYMQLKKLKNSVKIKDSLKILKDIFDEYLKTTYINEKCEMNK